MSIIAKILLLAAPLVAVPAAGGAALAGPTGLLAGATAGWALLLGAAGLGRRAVIALAASDGPADEARPETRASLNALAARAGVDPPRLQVSPDPSPNAFSVGLRVPGTIVVTRGLLEHLPDQEIEAVLAHELAHLERRDTTVGTVAAMLLAPFLVPRTDRPVDGTEDSTNRGRPISRARRFVAGCGVAAVALPLQVVLPRAREAAADRRAAQLVNDPNAVARALERVGSLPGSRSTAQRAISHLRFHTASPRGLLDRLVHTQPSTDERLAQLRLLGSHAARRSRRSDSPETPGRHGSYRS